MSFYRQQLEEWLAKLEVKAGVVLDIGGAQGPVKDRVKSWDVGFYSILDLPTFDVETDVYATGADIIFCLEVFEYLIDPFQAMHNISDSLNKDGKAYITFAFAYPHHNELELDSLRYTEKGVHRLAKEAGLRITDTWYRYDRSGLLKQFYAADGMHPAKEYPRHDVTGFIVEFAK